MVSDIVFVPVLLVTFGVVGAYTGWKRRNVHALMASVEPTPILEIDSPGTVEIEGTAAPADEPLAGPVTGRDAVVAAWKVEEWDERGDTSTWREVARGVEATSFVVEDHTGKIPVTSVSKRDTAGKWTQTTGVSASDGVRIDDTLAEFETFPTHLELAPGAAVPPAIRRLHEDHGLYEDTGSFTNAVDVGTEHGTRRYSEQVVAPGEEVYVLGHVERRGGDRGARLRPGNARLTEPDDGLLVVSDQSERSIEEEFAASSRALLYGGVAAVVAGVGLLAVLYAPA